MYRHRRGPILQAEVQHTQVARVRSSSLQAGRAGAIVANVLAQLLLACRYWCDHARGPSVAHAVTHLYGLVQERTDTRHLLHQRTLLCTCWWLRQSQVHAQGTPCSVTALGSGPVAVVVAGPISSHGCMSQLWLTCPHVSAPRQHAPSLALTPTATWPLPLADVAAQRGACGHQGSCRHARTPGATGQPPNRLQGRGSCGGRPVHRWQGEAPRSRCGASVRECLAGWRWARHIATHVGKGHGVLLASIARGQQLQVLSGEAACVSPLASLAARH